MAYPLPKGINKSELKRDVAGWEKRKFKDSASTLSQAVSDPSFISAWDVADLTMAEIACIHETFAKNPTVCLMLVQLKKQ
jgi:hypothetical protein